MTWAEFAWLCLTSIVAGASCFALGGWIFYNRGITAGYQLCQERFDTMKMNAEDAARGGC